MTPLQRHPQALIPPAMTYLVAKKAKNESTNDDGLHTVIKNTSRRFHHMMRRKLRITLFLLTPQRPLSMRNKPLLNCSMVITELKTEDFLMKKAEKVGLKMRPSPGALKLRTGRRKSGCQAVITSASAG